MKITVLFLTILLFFSQIIYPREQERLRVTVRDAHSGMAIKAAELAILEVRSGRQLPAGYQAAEGYFMLSPQPGSMLEIRAGHPAYRPLTTTFDASDLPEKPAQIVLRLRPVNSPDTDIGFTEPLSRPGEMLLQGYLADPAGQPVGNARISSSDRRLDIRSDEQGFFRGHIAVLQPNPEGIELLNIEVRHKDFAPLILQYYAIWPGGRHHLPLQLSPGKVDEHRDLRDSRTWGWGEDRQYHDLRQQIANSRPEPISRQPLQSGGVAPEDIVLPTSIRVKISDQPLQIEVLNLSEYLKGSLPGEWLGYWGELNNGMESLRAGAIAVRSYAAWFTYNPQDNNYDICATDACQVYNGGEYATTNLAIDETVSEILYDGHANNNCGIARSEYSAELNDSNNQTCGDGFTSGGNGWYSHEVYPCMSDNICQGFANNGHGKGMCQWGSMRWATQQNKTKLWILNHYYDHLYSHLDLNNIAPPAPEIINLRLPYAFGVQVTVEKGYNSTSSLDPHTAEENSAFDLEPLETTGSKFNIYAPVSGRVTQASGGIVKISPDYLSGGNINYTLVLEKLSNINVQYNQQVNQGDYIAKTNSTAGTVHLHLEGQFSGDDFAVAFTGSSKLEGQSFPNNGQPAEYIGYSLTSSNGQAPDPSETDIQLSGGSLNGTQYILPQIPSIIMPAIAFHSHQMPRQFWKPGMKLFFARVLMPRGILRQGLIRQFPQVCSLLLKRQSPLHNFQVIRGIRKLPKPPRYSRKVRHFSEISPTLLTQQPLFVIRYLIIAGLAWRSMTCWAEKYGRSLAKCKKPGSMR